MESRYIANDFSPLFTLAPDEPDRHLKQALEDIVAQRPPRDDYSDERLSGLWAGPTGFAYLFLHVARRRPQLLVAGQPARAWAERYMAGARTDEQLSLDLAARVGINCEGLAAEAVRACLTQDLAHVRAFVASVPEIVAGGEDGGAAITTTPDEMLQGRAGTLYMLRMMREWVAGSAPLVEEPIRSVTGAILAGGPGWRWHGKRYLGAVHGDAGIVTQLVLTTPPLAARLEDKVSQLLDAQLPGGNWPVAEESRDGGYTLVQFCHGAAGFLPSLVALRPHFPRLRQRIDVAIEEGRQCIWREGLLVKQPSICHGLFGSALALPRGPRRDHFLAVATPERADALAAKGGRLFEPADYGRTYPTISGELWSAAWTWMVCGEDSPGLVLYTDV